MNIKNDAYEKWLVDYINFCIENLIEIKNKGHYQESLIRHEWHMDALVECLNEYRKKEVKTFQDLTNALKEHLEIKGKENNEKI